MCDRMTIEYPWMHYADYVECYRGYEIYAVRGGYIAQCGRDSIDEIDLSALHRRIDRRRNNGM